MGKEEVNSLLQIQHIKKKPYVFTTKLLALIKELSKGSWYKINT